MELKYFSEFYKIGGISKFLREAKKAFRQREKIILYGDADMDGSSSVIILEETLRFLGFNVVKVYFPDREKEGYGINEKALLYLSFLRPAILITLDCGITNFDEVKLAKKMGFKTWIFDHHEVIKKTPPANLVIAPKAKNNPPVFACLSNAGLAFYLSHLLLKELGKDYPEEQIKEHLILAAIATIADMMPVKEINRQLIDKGVEGTLESQRPGLRVFWERRLIKFRNNRDLIQKIIAVLNITKCRNHLTGTYRLLRAKSLTKAEQIARELIKEEKERKRKLEYFVDELKKEIKDRKFDSEIIFIARKDYPISFAGPIASKIFSEFRKPTIIVSLQRDLARGAVRLPHYLDSLDALKSASKFLEDYGGHKAASGFTVKKEKLPQVEEALRRYFHKVYKNEN